MIRLVLTLVVLVATERTPRSWVLLLATAMVVVAPLML
jgi:hypothetical protein